MFAFELTVSLLLVREASVGDGDGKWWKYDGELNVDPENIVTVPPPIANGIVEHPWPCYHHLPKHRPKSNKFNLQENQKQKCINNIISYFFLSFSISSTLDLLLFSFCYFKQNNGPCHIIMVWKLCILQFIKRDEIIIIF